MPLEYRKHRQVVAKLLSQLMEMHRQLLVKVHRDLQQKPLAPHEFRMSTELRKARKQPNEHFRPQLVLHLLSRERELHRIKLFQCAPYASLLFQACEKLLEEYMNTRKSDRVDAQVSRPLLRRDFQKE